MFESAELGHEVDDRSFEERAPRLREALLSAQFDLVSAKRFPVIIVVGGVDGAGKGEAVNLLNEWMDARHIETHAVGPASGEELERPPMWRFWRLLPPKGRIGIFFGAWHTEPIVSRVYGETDDAALDAGLERVLRFERMLAAEGALIVKIWLHLSKKRQKKRLRALSNDPLTSWRVTKTDWKRFRLYDEFRKISERALRRTSTAEAPWLVIEGSDANYRALAVGTAILEAIKRRLGEPEKKAAPPPPKSETAPSIDGRSVIRALELGRAVDPAVAKERLLEAERRLNLVSRRKRFRERSVVAVFEGADAAGKGGAIRRVTRALDARRYRVVPIAAPTEEERAQPYLWRFWRCLGGRGRFTIFDRSWYGRVLVERVEGFCREADWHRAYEEINDFEEQLVRSGAVVVKFWLQISKEEQLARFHARESTGFKHYKITPEDWRNREKWDDYEAAVGEMVDRTSTEIAPWTLIEANDKHHARIKVLETLSSRLEAALRRSD